MCLPTSTHCDHQLCHPSCAPPPLASNMPTPPPILRHPNTHPARPYQTHASSMPTCDEPANPPMSFSHKRRSYQYCKSVLPHSRHAMNAPASRHRGSHRKSWDLHAHPLESPQNLQNPGPTLARACPTRTRCKTQCPRRSPSSYTVSVPRRAEFISVSCAEILTICSCSAATFALVSVETVATSMILSCEASDTSSTCLRVFAVLRDTQQRENLMLSFSRLLQISSLFALRLTPLLSLPLSSLYFDISSCLTIWWSTNIFSMPGWIGG